jgi:hypothetical protein
MIVELLGKQKVVDEKQVIGGIGEAVLALNNHAVGAAYAAGVLVWDAVDSHQAAGAFASKAENAPRSMKFERAHCDRYTRGKKRHSHRFAGEGPNPFAFKDNIDLLASLKSKTVVLVNAQIFDTIHTLPRSVVDFLGD